MSIHMTYLFKLYYINLFNKLFIINSDNLIIIHNILNNEIHK